MLFRGVRNFSIHGPVFGVKSECPKNNDRFLGEAMSNMIREKLIEAQRLWNKWLPGLPDKPIDEALAMLKAKEAEPEPTEFTKAVRQTNQIEMIRHNRHLGSLADVSIRWVLEACDRIDRLAAENERLKELSKS
jgi:hypothetical protein